jgi:hypothetical protein
MLTTVTGRSAAETNRPGGGCSDALDATLSRRGHLSEAVAGQVGQLHPLEVAPQPLNRVQLGRVAG